MRTFKWIGEKYTERFKWQYHVVLCMARDKSVALSEEELQKLKDARLKMFSTDEVPYGATISRLCEDVIDG